MSAHSSILDNITAEEIAQLSPDELADLEALLWDEIDSRCAEDPLWWLQNHTKTENPKFSHQKLDFKAPFPTKSYFRPLFNAFAKHSRLFIPKTREMITSWPVIGDPRLRQLAAKGLLIIFDSLIRFHSADENSATDMAPIMDHLKALTTAGATVVVLHHRSKAETSSYRGSSEIVAGADVVLALAKKEGLLELRTVKNRFAADSTITIQPDFNSGTLQAVDSPALTERKGKVDDILNHITENPGITQNKLIADLKLGNSSGLELLRSGEGRYWRIEPGPRNSKLYFTTATTPGVLLGSSGTSQLTTPLLPAPLRAGVGSSRGAGEEDHNSGSTNNGSVIG